jgi:putative spermidine/putrescine transport system ATP-binding protein
VTPGAARAPRPAAVRLSELSKTYGSGAPAVDRLSLDVAPGEFIALLGPSGCGKTTTLRMVAGLVEPSGGAIALDGRDITALPAHRRDMGLVFQSYALFPHLSVARNVAFGLEMRDVAREDIARRVDRALELVRLSGLQERRPRQLSGGQQQRVALARALVIEPSVLLLDEPLSNLDARLRDEMRNEIRDIQRALGITTLFVTHDQAEALAMSDRIAVMAAGRIAQVGTPLELYERPANPFVGEFIGRINRLEGRVAALENGLATIALAADSAVRAPAALTPGSAAVVMVRPHRLVLREPAAPRAAEHNRLAGRVGKAVYIGDLVQLHVETAAGRLIVEQATSGADWQRFAPGVAVAVDWRWRDSLAFAAEAR